MTKIVCDTNVWYELGAGRLAANFAGTGAELWASPVNFLELASHPEPERSSRRISAAKAVIDLATGVLDGPEDHIASTWFKLPPKPGEFWRLGFSAMSQGQFGTFQPIGDSRLAAVHPLLAQALRDRHYVGFESEIIRVIDTEKPGYAAARQAGSFQSMTKTEVAALRAKLTAQGFSDAIARGLSHRASLAGYTTPASPSPEELLTGQALFEVYIGSYREYLCEVAGLRAPQANDLGDLDQLLYLQEGWRFATRENRLKALVAKAGYSSKVVNA